MMITVLVNPVSLTYMLLLVSTQCFASPRLSDPCPQEKLLCRKAILNTIIRATIFYCAWASIYRQRVDHNYHFSVKNSTLVQLNEHEKMMRRVHIRYRARGQFLNNLETMIDGQDASIAVNILHLVHTAFANGCRDKRSVSHHTLRAYA